MQNRVLHHRSLWRLNVAAWVLCPCDLVVHFSLPSSLMLIWILLWSSFQGCLHIRDILGVGIFSMQEVVLNFLWSSVYQLTLWPLQSVFYLFNYFSFVSYHNCFLEGWIVFPSMLDSSLYLTASLYGGICFFYSDGHKSVHSLCNSAKCLAKRSNHV